MQTKPIKVSTRVGTYNKDDFAILSPFVLPQLYEDEHIIVLNYANGTFEKITGDKPRGGQLDGKDIHSI